MVTENLTRSEAAASAEAAIDSVPPLEGAGLLLQALDALCLRYGLPLVDRPFGRVAEEIVWLEGRGLAPMAYLAAAVACAARATGSGPAVAFGGWGRSAVLSHARAAVPLCGPEPDLFVAAEPGLEEMGLARVESPPRFLLARDLDRRFISLLAEDPVLSDARVITDPNGWGLAEALVCLEAARDRAATSGSLAEQSPTGQPATNCSVEMRTSRLVACTQAALGLVERETGAALLPGETWDDPRCEDLDPPAEWLALLPELPEWARAGQTFGPTAAETAGRWLALAPVPPSPSAAAALRTRAHLAHFLAAIAIQWPALGWAALGVPEDAVAANVASGTSVRLASPQGGADLDRTILGLRPWAYGEKHLTVLALGGPEQAGQAGTGERPGYAIVAEQPAAPTSVSVIRAIATETSGSPTWIEAALFAPRQPVVEIVVPLLGDRERDLERLDRVRSVLRDHLGPAPVRLVLLRDEYRRVIERGGSEGAAWSGALVDALESVLGPGCACLQDPLD